MGSFLDPPYCEVNIFRKHLANLPRIGFDFVLNHSAAAHITVYSSASLGAMSVVTWTIVGTCDVNGDGKGDLIWRSDTGTLAIWLLNGVAITGLATLGTIATNWQIAGASRPIG